MLQKTIDSRLKKNCVDGQNNNRKCFCRHLVYMVKSDMLCIERSCSKKLRSRKIRKQSDKE
jgi:chaperone required for assembly of F1-ATPase